MNRLRRALPTGISWILCSLVIGSLAGACGPEEESGASPFLDPSLAAADSIVAQAIADSLVPGAVLLVARDWEILLEHPYGVAQAMEWQGGEEEERPGGSGEEAMPSGGRIYDPSPEPVDSPVPMTTGTVFDLASVTKVMATTLAIMVLVDRGDLDLDTPVASHLPAFQVPGKSGITPRHLLTHTSGLPQWQPMYYRASTPGEALQAVAEMPLQWKAGEGRHYSDLGFMVLGYLVQAVSGRPLHEFLRDEVYGPLGLERTGFLPTLGPFAATSHGNPYEYRMVHDTAFGYRFRGDPEGWDGWRTYTLVGEVNDGNAHHAHGGVAGHAGLFSTARDLHLLIRILLDGGAPDPGPLPAPGDPDAEERETGPERQRLMGFKGETPISAATIRAFLIPALPGQALGWQIPAWAPAGSFSHTGFTGTFVMGVPGRDLVIILLTNRQNFGVDPHTRYPDLGALQRNVVEAVLHGG